MTPEQREAYKLAKQLADYPVAAAEAKALEAMSDEQR